MRIIAAAWRSGCSTTSTATCPRWRPCCRRARARAPTAGCSAATTRASAPGPRSPSRACDELRTPSGSAATGALAGRRPDEAPDDPVVPRRDRRRRRARSARDSSRELGALPATRRDGDRSSATPSPQSDVDVFLPEPRRRDDGAARRRRPAPPRRLRPHPPAVRAATRGRHRARQPRQRRHAVRRRPRAPPTRCCTTTAASSSAGWTTTSRRPAAALVRRFEGAVGRRARFGRLRSARFATLDAPALATCGARRAARRR